MIFEMAMRTEAKLDNKVAVVVGGGRGISQKAAFLLAKAGAAVAVIARNQSQINETVAKIRKTWPFRYIFFIPE